VKVLFDVNVILDLLLERQPFSEDAAKLIAAVELGLLNGFLCANSINTIYYLIRQRLGVIDAKRKVNALINVFDICLVNRAVLEYALHAKINDFEDAVIAEAGKLANVEAIVTRNAIDFKKSTLRIYQPNELLILLPRL
jgi:predicted nucleic acid-binding protein